MPHVFSKLPTDLYEVIVVDGHSVDGTPAVARQLRPDVRIITQNRRGKGNALACGFAAATGDIIAMIDADGSTDPSEIPRFVNALLEGADFAKGSRFKEGGGSSDITRLRRIGNRFLSSLVNALCRTQYSDLCYGFNVFWRQHVPILSLDATSQPPTGGARLWGDGFEVETLIHVRIAKAGLHVAEVASFEYSRIHGVSNLNAPRDGFRVLRIILTESRGARRSPGVSVPSANRRHDSVRTIPQGGIATPSSMDEPEWRGGPTARDIGSQADARGLVRSDDVQVTQADLACDKRFVATGEGMRTVARRSQGGAARQFFRFTRNQAAWLTDASSTEEGPV